MLHKILRIAAKELTGFFSSPAAFLFLAAFLGATLFIFFWVATFFERNLADVRPLFQWMPILLIFLVGALDHARLGGGAPCRHARAAADFAHCAHRAGAR